MNHHNKKFKLVTNSENGETSGETLFHYQQEVDILTAVYQGGKIKRGHLIGLVDGMGHIDMRYHQVNLKGDLMTGVCRSQLELM